MSKKTTTMFINKGQQNQEYIFPFNRFAQFLSFSFITDEESQLTLMCLVTSLTLISHSIKNTEHKSSGKDALAHLNDISSPSSTVDAATWPVYKQPEERLFCSRDQCDFLCQRL